MANLSGRFALVVGGETGIGRAAAEELAAAGATVTIAGILNEEGQAAVRAIKDAGGQPSFIMTDVRQPDSVDAAVSAAHGPGGKLDILVYSAGVFDGFASCLETSIGLWDQVIDINLKGCYLACRAALKTMVACGYGRIITIGSVASLIGGADGFPYTVSKAGMLGVVRQISTTYAKNGIAINAVCPGVVTTEIRANSARILGDVAPPMNQGIGVDPDGYKRFVPAHRRGTPAEVAALIAFLADERAGYITGQAIAIDGGWVAA